MFQPEDSELVPGATRWWDLEWKNPKWEYPDYDNLTVEGLKSRNDLF